MAAGDWTRCRPACHHVEVRTKLIAAILPCALRCRLLTPKKHCRPDWMSHRRVLRGGRLDNHIIPVVFRASSRLLPIDVIDSMAGSDASSAAKIARLGFPDAICASTSATTSTAEPR